MASLLLQCLAIIALFVLSCLGHEDHDNIPHSHMDHGHVHQAPMVDAKNSGGSWAATHMASEHHIGWFDAYSFFRLHDFDESGAWEAHEVHRLYGLDDASTDHLSDSTKEAVVRKVMDLLDLNQDGAITKEEWLSATSQGVEMPDFGYGPGHHGDDELEYELHHFEEFHGDDTTEEDLIHPEDIAHFKKHDREYAEAEMMEQFNKQSIVETNIPAKFRITRPRSII